MKTSFGFGYSEVNAPHVLFLFRLHIYFYLP